MATTRFKLTTTARDLTTAIDEAWHREHQEPTCHECEGTRISEDGTKCFDCTAADYQEEPR
jgi:hypothetical protein